MYLSPIVVLAVYFILQYDAVADETERLHLRAIAESQANTLDLYLTERQVNLANLIDDPAFPVSPGSSDLASSLERLQRISNAFVDLGFFDSSGVQTAYAGPYTTLERRSYRAEAWYTTLQERQESFIITDIYLGFRQKPHFTIAVSRISHDGLVVLRATLDPEKMYQYISSLEGSGEVVTSIVNSEGAYQLAPQVVARPLDTSSLVPPLTPRRGSVATRTSDEPGRYGYAWLTTVDWSVIVRRSPEYNQAFFSGFRLRIMGVAGIMVLVGFLVIVGRARKRVELQKDSETSRAQLSHAAKLASVGELAAGIAHEINNPLAAINEEAGLVKDLMNPELGTPAQPKELIPYLDSIQESVFRCRDITRKLLGFVRRTDFDLKMQNVHELLDEVIDGLLGHELLVSNVELKREYGSGIPEMMTDGNQLEQVFLNILNNAVDAMEGRPGRITVMTERVEQNVRVSVSDTGKGMSQSQIENIFLPFYTTKEVGRGTGLGLSVSYGIVKNLGGNIEVASTVGRGSTFTVVLPCGPGERGEHYE